MLGGPRVVDGANVNLLRTALHHLRLKVLLVGEAEVPVCAKLFALVQILIICEYSFTISASKSSWLVKQRYLCVQNYLQKGFAIFVTDTFKD